MDTAVRSRAHSAWKWLYTAWALIGIKLTITLLWSLQYHHLVARAPHSVQETLFWTTKITPPLFCAALVVWARDMGYRRLMYVFAALVVVVVPLDAAIVYAMLHGWKGWQF